MGGYAPIDNNYQQLSPPECHPYKQHAGWLYSPLPYFIKNYRYITNLINSKNDLDKINEIRNDLDKLYFINPSDKFGRVFFYC